MLTLTLFRHAKASPGGPDVADQNRPLNERGRGDAPLIGAQFAKLNLAPDRILCSTAVRTRETAALSLPGIPEAPPPDFLDTLYLASMSALLALLRRTPKAYRHLMIIGHNPGLHDLAVELAKTGNRSDLQRLASKLPTAGLVVLSFPVETWSGVRSGGGRLVHFVTPRQLTEDAHGD